MNISLSTKTFDPKGLIKLDFDSDSELQDYSRRATRTATLDGSASFDDLGFSWADVTFKLKFKDLTQTQADSLSYLCQNYGQLRVVTENGVFDVLVEKYAYKKGVGQMTLLVLEKVSA